MTSLSSEEEQSFRRELLQHRDFLETLYKACVKTTAAKTSLYMRKKLINNSSEAELLILGKITHYVCQHVIEMPVIKKPEFVKCRKNNTVYKLFSENEDYQKFVEAPQTEKRKMLVLISTCFRCFLYPLFFE
jgi:uncharacterized protein involved in tolerance to divalent cations